MKLSSETRDKMSRVIWNYLKAIKRVRMPAAHPEGRILSPQLGKNQENPFISNVYNFTAVLNASVQLTTLKFGRLDQNYLNNFFVLYWPTMWHKWGISDRQSEALMKQRKREAIGICHRDD